MGSNEKLIRAIDANLLNKVMILARTSDLTRPDGNGMTPLDHAAWHNFMEVAQALVDAGAPRNAKSAAIAARRKSEGMVGIVSPQRR